MSQRKRNKWRPRLLPSTVTDRTPRDAREQAEQGPAPRPPDPLRELGSSVRRRWPKTERRPPGPPAA